MAAGARFASVESGHACRELKGESVSKVRRASGDDVQDIIELNQQVLSLHAALYPERFKPQADQAELLAMFTRFMADDAHVVAVHRDSGRAEGYVWLEVQERPETALTWSSRRIYIHHIVVADGARRQGIGSALMRWVEDHAATLGVGQIVLEHWAANEAAQTFFSRAGFSPIKSVVRKELVDGHQGLPSTGVAPRT
jgi:ribosomal protein S18 acetylase RimI-like enzyme